MKAKEREKRLFVFCCLAPAAILFVYRIYDPAYDRYFPYVYV